MKIYEENEGTTAFKVMSWPVDEPYATNKWIDDVSKGELNISYDFKASKSDELRATNAAYVLLIRTIK